MIKLREQPEKEAKAFLKKHFGDSPEHLKKTIAHGEVLLGEHRDSEYTEFHARTDEEKLYAQVCCKSLVNRLRIYYDDLNPRDKETYKREALAAMSSKKGVTYLLEDPGSFAAGKSPEGFLDDVTKTMDLSKEKSIMEHLRTIAPAGDPERREKLHLTDPAVALRDDVQLQLLKNRRDKAWMKQNIEDLTAKAICAQVLMNGGTPGDQQRSAPEGDAFKAQLEKIKANDSFKQMMKTVDQDKIADAIIKGGTGLAEVFQKSVNASKQAGSPQGAPELDPKDLAPAKDAPGLSSPVR